MARRTAAWFGPGPGRGPHWFRRCLTTTAASEAPARALDAAILLGHSPRVSLAHYNEAKAAAALRRHGARLAALRRRTAALAAAAFREDRTGAAPVGRAAPEEDLRPHAPVRYHGDDGRGRDRRCGPLGGPAG